MEFPPRQKAASFTIDQVVAEARDRVADLGTMTPSVLERRRGAVGDPRVRRARDRGGRHGLRAARRADRRARQRRHAVVRAPGLPPGDVRLRAAARAAAAAPSWPSSPSSRRCWPATSRPRTSGLEAIAGVLLQPTRAGPRRSSPAIAEAWLAAARTRASSVPFRGPDLRADARADGAPARARLPRLHRHGRRRRVRPRRRRGALRRGARRRRRLRGAGGFERRDGRVVLVRQAAMLGSPNEGAPKAVNIQAHIGRRPILAAGNSAGDREMLEYAHTGEHPSLCLVVDHDDAEREYAYAGAARDRPGRRADPADRERARLDGGEHARRLEPGLRGMTTADGREAWIAAADVPDGLGRPLPRGGAGPARRRRRVLDRPLPGHQPPVRRLRGRDRLRHRRRAPARPGGLPGRAGREPRAGLAGVHAHAAGRSTCATSTSGGPGRRARAGAAPRGRARRWPGARSTRSSTSPTRTRPRTPTWAGARCRPRPSGSSPPAAGSTARPTSGATSPSRHGARLANYWHGDFPWRAGAGLRDDRAGRLVRAQRLRAVRHGRQRLGVDGGLVRRQRGGEPRTRPSRSSRSRARSQGRLVPVRRQLLPALPARCAAPADDRHGHEPHRLPLRAPRPLVRGPRTSGAP